MDGVAMAARERGTASVGVGAPQMPLAFASMGQAVKVLKVRGGAEMHHHLENLGFVEGACVKVVCANAGNLIVEIKGSQVALDRQVGMKVIVAS